MKWSIPLLVGFAAVLFAHLPTSPAHGEDGPVQEVKRGAKTIHVYHDAEDYKLQAVIPDEVGWSHQLPPFQNRIYTYFQVLQGTRDLTVEFMRTPAAPGQDASAFLDNFEANMKQSFSDYERDMNDRIFSGRAIESGKKVDFFATGQKGELFAFKGVRMFQIQARDPQGNPTGQPEIKPDPEGKVMYNQVWAVPRTIGNQSHYFIFWIQVPMKNLDRKDPLNRPTIEGLSDLFRSIRFLK